MPPGRAQEIEEQRADRRQKRREQALQATLRFFRIAEFSNPTRLQAGTTASARRDFSELEATALGNVVAVGRAGAALLLSRPGCLCYVGR